MLKLSFGCLGCVGLSLEAFFERQIEPFRGLEKIVGLCVITEML